MKKLSVVMFVVCICLCISCAQLISNVILSTVGYSTAISSQYQSVYALCLHKNEDKSDVEEKKETLQAQNGAGFVYQKDGNYYLIASIYENINDAEHVKNNLKSSGTDSEILTIKLDDIKIEGSFSSDEKTILNNCIKSKYEIFQKLYDVVVSLDTNLIDKSKAKLSLSEIFSSTVALKTNFETVFSQNIEEINLLKKQLSNSCQQLSNLVSEQYDSNNQTFSSLIKLCYCKILLGTY